MVGRFLCSNDACTDECMLVDPPLDPSTCSGAFESLGGSHIVYFTGEGGDGNSSDASAECEPGHQQSSDGNHCTECGIGRFSVTGDECVECEPGTYADTTGSVQCQSCGAGNFQNQNAQSRCMACAEGTFQPAEGKTGCMQCESGTTSGVGASECDVEEDGNVTSPSPSCEMGSSEYCIEFGFCPPGDVCECAENKEDATCK